MAENDEPTKSDARLTVLLRGLAKEGPGSADALMRAIQTELHQIAARHMRKERLDHTLQPTALVNEAYMRLMGGEPKDWNDRNHFFAVAARVMRQILIDHARSRNTGKRGGQKVELDLADAALLPLHSNVLDVDIALQELAAIAPRQAQLVELRFFGGLSLEEATGVLDMAPRTADKDWSLAKAWLRRRLRTNSKGLL